ncbi:hypothetical protein INH39_23915 [Massilia violaceinigra]|uniref:Uncharacterized protein n=1 Tax=Massilia violaceinigra TaxID=2045208 RepID=A0ABY4A136_9BURK|nr:hypothetical protein [Massilia violaceinigra]UOD28475.1 hypothetical protein INH39_23915 [Massilia violaceinigra]
MTTLPIVENLCFTAHNVAADEKKFSGLTVNGLYFSDRAFATGGEDWYFTRSYSKGNGRIATTVDSMELTVYQGIVDFAISRTGIVCEFDPVTAEETRVRCLTIDYHIDDAAWADVLTQAKLVFINATYFRVRPAAPAVPLAGDGAGSSQGHRVPKHPTRR